MSEAVHWIAFLLHLLAAFLIAFGVWLRCDPDVWVSKFYVDTYAVQANSSGLWWYDQDLTPSEASLLAACSSAEGGKGRTCYDADLPLYEKAPSGLGWHLFVLLGHFEWVSSAFAYFYISHRYKSKSWVVSIVWVVIGTLVYMPYRGSAFVNEVVLLWANCLICCLVFYSYRRVHALSAVSPAPASAAQAAAPSDREGEEEEEDSAGAASAARPLTAKFRHFRLSGEGTLAAGSLRDVRLPALRFAEYCITAAELWVAVLCVYVQDPPAFITIGGYTLILLTNLYGLLLHYSLVSSELKTTLMDSRFCVPSKVVPSQVRMESGRVFRIPVSMLRADAKELAEQYVEWTKLRMWGSYIASNSSTLLNSWLAYAVAMSLIFYQQTFLFSSDPPAFVVFAGWSLIVTYTSFGVWVTLAFLWPRLATKVCRFTGEKETFRVLVIGLDVLSLSAKLSIVGSLSYGFIFRGEGRC